MFSLGIIKEGKSPPDKRTPLTPEQCKEIQERFPEVNIQVQSSNLRCFSDREYRQVGITVKQELSDCNILLGIKEVPIAQLLAHKTYCFFSHTIKSQPYNRDLLINILKKNITLIDYEILTDRRGLRLIAFGEYAGLVGAYNAMRAYGMRTKLFDLIPAHQCHNLKEVWEQLPQVVIPSIKIAVVGGGRVAKGVIQILDSLQIESVSSKDFLAKDFKQAVYVQLNPKDYNRRKDGQAFEIEHFYQNPKQYESTFSAFTQQTNILIAAAYWHPKAPVLFTAQQMKQPDFSIRTIADITCDIAGSIPSTKRASTIAAPFYDYDPQNEVIKAAFSDTKHVNVMAIDNLPNELPRDSSESFGRQLIKHVLPELLKKTRSAMIERATIARRGKLTKRYMYLQDFIAGDVSGL